ncbi:MAG: HEPN domain-containing protein [Verrucomicrobia bacterium]|nr:HEPN domain-containing protein [Verrucomicrobiota bacterium]
MTPAAQQWFQLARLDIKSAAVLLNESDLSTVVIFHSQQAVEKLLKAVLEARRQTVPKTHDLERLYALIDPPLPGDIDHDSLALLSSYYVNVRYPAMMAFPSGPPSVAQAKNLLDFAVHIESIVKQFLEAKILEQ